MSREREKGRRVVSWEGEKGGRIVRWQGAKGGRVVNWQVSGFIQEWGMQGDSKISSFCF